MRSTPEITTTSRLCDTMIRRSRSTSIVPLPKEKTNRSWRPTAYSMRHSRPHFAGFLSPHPPIASPARSCTHNSRPQRYRDGLLSPRDIVELQVVAQTLSKEEIAAAAKATLGTPEAHAARQAFDTGRALVLGDNEEMAALSPAARAWAERAIAGFGCPGRRRASTLLRWSGWHATEVLVNPARRAHYIRRLRRSGALSRALDYHRETWHRTQWGTPPCGCSSGFHLSLREYRPAEACDFENTCNTWALNHGHGQEKTGLADPRAILVRARTSQ